jgi:hypothetical protein
LTQTAKTTLKITAANKTFFTPVCCLALATPKKILSMSQTLYNILLHAHSVGRWIVLLLLVIGIFNSLVAGQRPFIRSDANTGLLLTIFADLMLLIGLALWYFGDHGYKLLANYPGGFGAAMKDPYTRFFGMEHITAMLIAIVLIHIGKAQGKKKFTDRKKHVRTMLFYLLALIVILATVPWPFMQIGTASHWY